MDTLATRSLKAVTLVISLATISLLLKHGNSQFPNHPSYIFHSCYSDNSGNYTKNSPFDNNLRSVLSDLATHASVSQFHASSAGSGLSTAYGLYYCRHDLSLQLCSDCVKMAITNASAGSYCYPLMEGGSWYQECTLRYSNNILLGVSEDWPRGWWYSLGIDVSDPDQHNRVLSMAMKRNIRNAAIDDVDGFVIAQDEVSPFETLYSLVQCRPDINGSVCQSCLLSLFNNITYVQGNPEWLLLYNPSCQLRYGATLFYNNETTSPPTPTPPFSSISPPSLPSPLPPSASSSASGR